MQAAGPELVSANGRWIVRADNDAHVLHIVDARSGDAIDRIALADRQGRPATAARFVEALPRASFIVLFRDIAEAWELVYMPGAEPAFDGLVHDYRSGEAIAQRSIWPLRRVVLDEPLHEFLFAPDFAHGIARARDGRLHVINLHVRRRIETLQVDGEPLVNGGVAWVDADGTHFALPDASGPLVHVIDGGRWRVGRVAVAGTPVLLRGEGEGIRIDAGGAARLWRRDELRRAAGF